jgi:hypothetical protein
MKGVGLPPGHVKSGESGSPQRVFRNFNESRFCIKQVRGGNFLRLKGKWLPSLSPLPVLFPDSARLSVETIRNTDGTIAIGACATGQTATRPVCSSCYCHVHSQFDRTLRDLPWQDTRVRIHLRTRRFYCRRPDCRRKIFTERFAHLTGAYGRQTTRNLEVLKRIGMHWAARGDSDRPRNFAVDASTDTILRVVQENVSCRSKDPVKVYEVDDWALWKGQR